MVQLASCLDCYGAGGHLFANPFPYALQNLTVCRREYYCHAVQSGGGTYLPRLKTRGVDSTALRRRC